MTKLTKEQIATQVEKVLRQMSLEQRVGQCFTYLWSGYLITPSVVDAIEKLHCGNLRLQPAFVAGKRFKYYNFDTAAGRFDYPRGYVPAAENLLLPGCMGEIGPQRYAEALNRLQEIATRRPGGVPLNMAIDQEGDLSRNYCFGGINLLPSPMGMAASQDPKFIRSAYRAMARQLRAMGITCVQSPVVDVNIDPRNPEIGARSFGDDPEQVAQFALAAMQGMQDGGVITTAKHFPGRGDSSSDAHFGTPQLDVPRSRLDAVELVPYRTLIKNGLDSIMIAHNIYTALDRGVIATVSKKILRGLLRDELGFEGVITTDAIAMQALMRQYPLPEACARALEAGVDMVLNKTETAYRDQGYLTTLRFVQEGRITEDDLNDKVRRILTMKMRRGLFENRAQVDAKQAGAPIRERAVINLCREAAERATLVMTGRRRALPLSPKQRIMVIEQKLEDVFLGLNPTHHRLSLTEAILQHTGNVLPVDTQFAATKEDQAFILPLIRKGDVVVATNHVLRSEGNNGELIRKILRKGARVILVTNTIYAAGFVPGVEAVICTFADAPEGMQLAAEILFGRAKPRGKWPLRNYPVPKGMKLVM